MTAHRITEIRCDGPRPGTPCPDSAALTWDGNASYVRETVCRPGGWATKLPAGQDRCPQCRKATR